MIKQSSNFSDKLTETFRSKLDQKVEVEPAWKTLTNKPGIDVWRINQFKLEVIPKSEHGNFYDGDSYIVLHTYESKSRAMHYDAFVWIGKHSTADEYGTAAYKMAELDVEVLNDVAVQHREVQGMESDKFLAVFPTLTLMKGGVATGFRETKKGEYTPKLYHVCGIKRNVQVMQVSYRKNNLTEDDVYVIDHGDMIYQVNGKTSSKEEKFKGAQVVNNMKAANGKAKSEVIDDYTASTSHPVIDAMPVKEKNNMDKVEERVPSYSLWKVSDETGKMQISEVKQGKAKKTDFQSDDVFIYDTNLCIFVWVGNKTSKKERMLAMIYAQKYADDHDKKFLALQKVMEGSETSEILNVLA